MRTVFILLDSLNRAACEPYGSTDVRTPNLARLAERAVTFDNHHVGSLPCMPARRDLHTGRINFLHRSWGPLEPFDHSFPEILKRAGVHTHIVTDHHHYFADGGGTYHPRYSTWELVRGQAIDRWKAEVAPDEDALRGAFHPVQQHRRAYMVNRKQMVREEDYCCPQVFSLGEAFLRTNHEADDWLLQIECFDPHEPFHAPERFRRLYPRSYSGPILDWPLYREVEEGEDEIAELRANYAALTTMCDEYLGRTLDLFDALDLWADTALVVTTDHGFLLGEHGWWAKNRMPVYDEIARIPLFIHHPDHREQGGQRRSSLTQTTDLMPTFVDLHGQPVPEGVLGRSLVPLLERDLPLRDALIFGYFGAACNVTDGRYVLHRYPERMTAENLYEYTLMPTRMTSRMSIEELAAATLVDPQPFANGSPVLRVPAQRDHEGDPTEPQGMSFVDTTTALYDLWTDPAQAEPIEDEATMARLLDHMGRLARAADAPPELLTRLGLT